MGRRPYEDGLEVYEDILVWAEPDPEGPGPIYLVQFDGDESTIRAFVTYRAALARINCYIADRLIENLEV